MVEALLGGRYEVWGFLGRGGFAAVYQVRSTSLQRFEALKVLHASHGEDSDFAKRFRQEARVAASLEHPSSVKIYDFGHVEETLWYSMQFVEGPTLKEEITKRGTFDEETTARIAVPLLDALDYSHARGVIHRDIKPDNVLLDARGRPYLLDFGIAKTGDNLVKTQTGFILGSPAYLSPEQLRGQPLDGRTDVYSLGVTLYLMLAGVIPYRTENMSALARRLTEDAPPLSTRREGIHPEFERIVHRSLERSRDARYANAAEMRDDVESFLADVYPRTTRARRATSESSISALRPGQVAPPEPAPPPEARPAVPPAAPTPAPAPVPQSKNPAWLMPFAAALVLTLLAGGWLLLRGSAPRPAPVATPTRAVAPTRAPAAAATAAPTLAPATSPAVAPTLAPTSVPTLAPTRVPVLIPTVAPLPIPTAPAPTRAPTSAPQAKPTPLPTPTRIPRPREAPTPAATAAQANSARHAKTPPDVLEEALISLTSSQALECGGKVVGVSVVVGEDGRLLRKHVISPDSATCNAIALEAVSRNRYKPALDERGKPVEGRINLSVRF